jgi:hypothetical protein
MIITTTKVTMEGVDIVMAPEIEHIMLEVDMVLAAGEDATIIAKGKETIMD